MNLKPRLITPLQYAYSIIDCRPELRDYDIDFFEELEQEDKKRISGLILKTDNSNDAYEYFYSYDWKEIVDWMAGLQINNFSENKRHEEELIVSALDSMVECSSRCLKERINLIFKFALENLIDDIAQEYLEAA